MPLSHYSLPVGAHYNAMKAFYTAILQPLGYAPAIEGEQYCGFAPPNGPPDFWLGGGRVDNGLPLYDGDLAQRIAPVHVAFQADSQEAVDAWYEHAIKSGAVDNGKPGLREHYSKGYYAAFVLDPLGNNIELLHFVP